MVENLVKKLRGHIKCGMLFHSVLFHDHELMRSHCGAGGRGNAVEMNGKKGRTDVSRIVFDLGLRLLLGEVCHRLLGQSISSVVMV